MPSTIACTSSMWAKQFAAVTTLRRPVSRLTSRADLRAEIALDGRDAAAVGDVADIGRLDAEDAVAAVLEVRQQRAVVGADIDDEIVLAEAEHGGDLAVQIGEIVAQQIGGAAGVGIFRREDDDRIDREAELHQVAVRGNAAGWSETTAAGAGPGRSAPSGSPAACNRATAHRRAARGRRPGSIRPERCPGAGGARDFRGTQDYPFDYCLWRKVGSLLPVPVERRRQALVERHVRLIAQPAKFRNVRTAPHACRPRAARRAQSRSRAWRKRRCAAPGPRW